MSADQVISAPAGAWAPVAPAGDLPAWRKSYSGDPLELLDAGKARRLLGLLVGFVACAEAALIVMYWREHGKLFSGVPVANLLLMLGVLACLQRGQLRAAISLLVWGLTATALYAGIWVAGLNSPALIILPVLGTCAGWLLGRRQTLWLVAVTLCALAGIGWLQAHDAVPNFVERSPSMMFVIIGVASSFGALLGMLSMRSYRGEFLRAVEMSEALAHQLEASAASERRFTTLFRVNPLPSTITDDKGVYMDVNDAWLRMNGYAREEVIGQRGIDIPVWVNHERFDELLALLERDGRLYSERLRMRTVGGEREFLVYSEAVAIDGKLCYVHVQLDQSDRLAAEAAQHEIQTQLESRVAERTAELHQVQEELLRCEKLAALGSVVAGISHELNTPLGNANTVASSLQHQAGALKQSLTESSVRRSVLQQQLQQLDDMADLIQRSIQRAAELVASFKKVAIDQTSERRRTFDLADVVHDVVATMRPGLHAQPLTIDLALPKGLQCDSYPGPLGQIISNLVQNAAVHAFAPEAAGRIAIEAHNSGDQIVLTVSDDGCGMDAATLARAFDPFFTTKLGQGGSGLGLSISHRLATTVLGGILSARSECGSGSEFRLSFPRLAPGRV